MGRWKRRQRTVLTCALGLQDSESTGNVKRCYRFSANLENKTNSSSNPKEIVIINYVAYNETQEPKDWPQDGEVPTHAAIALCATVYRICTYILRAHGGR